MQVKDAEIIQTAKSGRKHLNRVSEVRCDQRINLFVNEKVYKTVVRPAIMYEAETWAVKKAQEKKLNVAEIKVWSHKPGPNKEQNNYMDERIRGTIKVGEISKKVEES